MPMDLISILNIEDVPPYRPSSPLSESSHEVNTPPTPSESSPVMSYSAHSPVKIEVEVERRLRCSSRESTASPDRCASSRFTAVNSRQPKTSRRQSTSGQSAEGDIREVNQEPSEVSGSSTQLHDYSSLPIHGPGVEGVTSSESWSEPSLAGTISLQESHPPGFAQINTSTQESTPQTSFDSHPLRPVTNTMAFSRFRLESITPKPTPRLPGFHEILQRGMHEFHGSMATHSSSPSSPSPTLYKMPEQNVTQQRIVNDDYDSDATISDHDEDENERVHPSSADEKPKCAFQDNCDLNSPVRPVISHYFGRNKKETRAIPKEIWLNYCRQHYQRSKYRLVPEKYAQRQMDLVRSTVRNLEQWGGVTDFEISLRKRVKNIIAQEDRDATSAPSATTVVTKRGSKQLASASKVKERWMLPYCGKHKGFTEVYDLIDAVIAHCQAHSIPAPEFELVPSIKPHIMARSNSSGHKRSLKKARTCGAKRASTSAHTGSSKRSHVAH